MSTHAKPPRIDVQSLLAEFDASGQSAAAFARARGIAPWRIYHALERRSGKARSRRGSARAPEPTLLPVRVVADQVPSSSASLEILLANGHRVRIGPDFDPALLRRLLGALAPC